MSVATTPEPAAPEAAPTAAPRRIARRKGARPDGSAWPAYDEATGAPPNLDLALVRSVLAEIEANPASWDQTTWHCESSHCFAGHAEIKAGLWAPGQDNNVTWGNAQHALGLSSAQSDWFFDGPRTLPELKALGSWLEGFDASGFDRAGFSRDGFSRDGFSRAGFSRAGFSRAGFSRDGFSRDGFSRDGFNRDGLTEDEAGQIIEI